MEWLWNLAAYNPYYARMCSAGTQRYFTLTGMVLLLLCLCSLGFFFFFGYSVLSNPTVGVVSALLFTFIQFNFYRMVLLSISWYPHNARHQAIPNRISSLVKISFISCNILILCFCIVSTVFNSRIEAEILQRGITDGVITRFEMLYEWKGIAGFLTFLFWLFFTWPVISRCYVPAYGGIDYDRIKSEDETGRIKMFYKDFLKKYKYTLHQITEGKARDIIYDNMQDPPFDKRLKAKRKPVLGMDDFFEHATSNPPAS